MIGLSAPSLSTGPNGRRRDKLIKPSSWRSGTAGFAVPIVLELGIPSDCRVGGSGNDVIQRNPVPPKWRNGLAACDLIVADVLAAKQLPKHIFPTVLRLVPDSFLNEARKLVTVGA
jgi:hypothetical protein